MLHSTFRLLQEIFFANKILFSKRTRCNKLFFFNIVPSHPNLITMECTLKLRLKEHCVIVLEFHRFVPLTFALQLSLFQLQMVLSSEGYLSQSFKRAMIVNYEKSMGQPKYHGGGLQCNFHWSFLWAVIAFVSEYVGSKRSRKALSMVTKRSKLPPCPIWWDDGSGKTS